MTTDCDQSWISVHNSEIRDITIVKEEVTVTKDLVFDFAHWVFPEEVIEDTKVSEERSRNMTNEEKVKGDISNADILKAMMGFKEDIAKNIDRLENKMDIKLEEVAGEIKKIETKADKRMDIMDGRLDKLENEMRRFQFGRIKSNSQKLMEMPLNSQPAGRIDPPPPIQKPVQRNSTRKDIEAINDDEIDWFASPSGYKSTWAKSLDKELGVVNDDMIYEDEKKEKEELMRKRNEREVRKMKEIERIRKEESEKKWMEKRDKSARKMERQRRAATEKAFGLEDDTTSESDTNYEDYDTVDRIEKNKDKKRKALLKKKTTKIEILRKANLIVRIGPIDHRDIAKHKDNAKDYKEAKIKAVEDFLRQRLKYNDEEMERIEIKDTQTAKDDTIYVAMTKVEDIKEVYIGKAEIQDDEIWACNDRFKYLNNACKDFRVKN